ncbi:Iron-sulfur clusters transporter atm1, mitochondrial [Hypoxylon texense]
MSPYCNVRSDFRSFLLTFPLALPPSGITNYSAAHRFQRNTMVSLKLSAWLCTAACISAVSPAPIRQERRQEGVEPKVNLGYETHLGTYNSTGHYYSFNNIPYAEQPVGGLRFDLPAAIRGTHNVTNNGTSLDIICPQAFPQWVVDSLAARRRVDSETVAAELRAIPGQNEGCLYLDVYVPPEVFYQGPAAKAPVLVWIHGGGFTFGSKTMYGDPAGLLARSRQDGEPGVIVVAINYRLGLFGWLGGDVPANLGLLDQRRAFIWLQQYIDLFGGDPERITLMGESAGAASIVHHITAFEEKEYPLFHGAIPLSPAWQYDLDVFEGYAKTMDVASAVLGHEAIDWDDLRKVPFESLKDINEKVVGSAPFGQFGYGPSPDGTYVGDNPQVGLHYGHMDPRLKLLISHTSNESAAFVPPPSALATDDDVRQFVARSLRQAPPATIDELLTNDRLYPDEAHTNSRVAYPWRSPWQRAVRLSSDVSFACTTRYLALAGRNATYNYKFAYPPGWHAGDVPYVFFFDGNDDDDGGDNNGFPVNATLARELQDYIVSFARIADPNAAHTTDVRFPVYGAEARILELTEDGFKEEVDDLKGERCDWIQQAMIDGRL